MSGPFVRQDGAVPSGEGEVGALSERVALLEAEVERLNQSESYFRRIFDFAPDAMLVVDGEGTVAYANAQVKEVLGYDAEDLIGRSVDTLVPTGFRGGHRDRRAQFAAKPRTRAMGAGMELAALRKDGSTIPVDISLSPLSIGQGSGVLCAIRDVTERRANQTRLRELNESLEQRVRQRTEELEQRTAELERSNAELEQFAYVASHDLQEPLRMVSSYVRLLSRHFEGKLDADAEEFMGYALEGATRMQQLIKDLLQLSRVGTQGRPAEPAHAAVAFESARSNLSEAIKVAGATLTVAELPIVKADIRQLAQLFQNLIGNAIKFCGEEPPVVAISAERLGEVWQFSVRDNGIGIEEEFRDRIFVVFQRLHPRDRYPGTGIGLAICQKIVERHGGRIWVESNPGPGSTFHFTIPAAPAQEESGS